MFIWILLAFAALILFIALVAIYLFRRSLPQMNGNVRVPGLTAPIEVLRDEWGVPHIYAANQDDLFFAQGYVHAQDRLWQMEMNRRLCNGTLSELFGGIALDTDRLLRTLGFRRAAEQDLTVTSAATRHALETYARGVNAFLAQNSHRLPPEFLLLGCKPAPWQPLDTIVWAKYMGWGLSANWDMELLRAAFIGKLGENKAAQLEPENVPGNPSILPPAVFRQVAKTMLEQFRAAKTFLPPIGLRGASNNWVVDGTKTTTGKPLLANDPHLPILLPGIWYEVHLVAPDFESTGVSFPGAPGVIIGHNREIAWGFTNAFPDVQDLFVEKPNPSNPREFEFRGKWEPATVVREEIRVKGRTEPHVEEIVVTRHGPIINRIAPVAESAPPLALRWVGHEPGRLMDAVMKMNRARNWNEFTDAVRDWTLPSQNMVYADRAGNIGYYQPGLIPIRAKGMGATPVPGWTGEYEWAGWIPHEELPHAFNPTQHLIATANNQVVGADYKHFLALDYSNGNRAARITALLTEKIKLTPDDFARMHLDFYCAPAKKFIAHLGGLTPHDPFQVRALDALRNWDGCLTADSVAGGIYKTMEYFALRRVYADKLGELADYFIGVGFHPVIMPITMYYDRSLVTLEQLLEQEHSEWYTDAATGQARSRDEILALALSDAVAALRQHLGDHMTRWTWGNQHHVDYHHTLGAQKPLDRIFNRPSRSIGGDPNTICQVAFVPHIPVQHAHFAPSWRQIIDLADWDNSRAVHTPGQSGHPASKHYDDMIDPWLRGEYHALLWSRAHVEQHAVARLALEP
jgi:penicillin amidase